MDYIDWIQNYVENVALESHNVDLCDLPEELQLAIYNKAVEDYIGHVADLIDRDYERLRDKLCQLG